MKSTRVAWPAAVLLALTACGGMGSSASQPDAATALAAGAPADMRDPSFSHSGTYAVRDLVSDGAVPAEHTDAALQNAWGLDALPTTPWWVADNHSGLSTLYDAQGVAQPAGSPLVVTIPGDGGQPGAPTGLVANPTSDFVITMGGATGPARFIFAGEDGTISAWMKTTPIATAAVMTVPAAGGAVFKGLALVTTAAGSRLYATDFHNGLVRVFDGAFQPVMLPPGAFTDRHIPAGFAPFGIRVIQNAVVLVSYAKQDDVAHDDVAGPGNGFVDAYSTGGRLLARLASRGKLNSPWGMALAPAGFGRHSFRLLVGNFGDGHIVSFGLHREDGRDRGDQDGDMDDDGVYLRGGSGPIVIEKLWGLAFANGGPSGPSNVLFFTAGPNDESDGLFGRIDPPASP